MKNEHRQASVRPTSRQQRPESSAPKRGHGLHHNWLSLLFATHLYACFSSLGKLSRAPFASLLTIAVIGISLALPTGLFLLLTSTQNVLGDWDQSAQISLFLQSDVSATEAEQLLALLQDNPKITEARYISPEQGMEDFQVTSGFKDVLQVLPSNPLPGVIMVKPELSIQSPGQMQLLVQSLQELEQVDMAQLDMEWLQRLQTFISLVRRGVGALAALLALGVVLVVGNTIRLAIETYKDELEIIKLFGGSNAFVRRPFLYTGLFYGAFGGVIAWLCVDFVLYWLQAPVTRLTELYQATPMDLELGAVSIVSLLTVGGSLGVLGAYLVVQRQLKVIDNAM